MSDKKNDELELKLWQQRVNDHMEEYERDKKEAAATMTRLTSLTEQNATQISSLVESTKGVVSVHNDVVGAVNVAKKLGIFVKWFGGLAVAAAAVDWAVELITQLNP